MLNKSRELNLSLAFFCGCIGLLLYISTWQHGYVLDDVAVIQQNRFTQQGLKGIPSMLTTFYWEGYWSSNAGLYRPLSLITFAIEHEFFPNNPHASHVVNSLLYALTGFLLFCFVSLLLSKRRLWLAFAATLIFITHPVHTEVVANIKSRDEILCFLFFIAAAYTWLKWHEGGKRLHLVFTITFYFLSLLSKETAVVFLPVFPLMLYFFGDASFKQSFRGFWAVILPFVLFLAIHTWVIQSSDSLRVAYTYRDNALFAAPDLASRTATALSTTLHYFKLLVFPHPLSHDYSYNAVPIVTFSEPRVILASAIIVVLAIITWRGFRSRSVPSFAILFFAITFSVTSNLFTLIGSTMAERFLYTPSLGFALLAAFLMERYLLKSSSPPATPSEFFMSGKKFLTVLALVVVPFVFLTVQRSASWKDELTLFAADVRTVPNSAKTHYDYATVYMNEVAQKIQGQQRTAAFRRSMEEFRKALAIDQNYYEAWRNLAIAAYNAGDYGQSAAAMEHAVKLLDTEGINFLWLGKANFRMNRFGEALDAFKKGLTLGAKMDDTYSTMGSAYFSMQNYKDAIVYYKKALEEHPRNTETMNNLAGAYGMEGNYNEAVTVLLQSHELHPQNANTCYLLAITYSKMGNEADAELWIDKARKLGMNI